MARTYNGSRGFEGQPGRNPSGLSRPTNSMGRPSSTKGLTSDDSNPLRGIDPPPMLKPTPLIGTRPPVKRPPTIGTKPPVKRPPPTPTPAPKPTTAKKRGGDITRQSLKNMLNKYYVGGSPAANPPRLKNMGYEPGMPRRAAAASKGRKVGPINKPPAKKAPPPAKKAPPIAKRPPVKRPPIVKSPSRGLEGRRPGPRR